MQLNVRENVYKDAFAAIDDGIMTSTTNTYFNLDFNLFEEYMGRYEEYLKEKEEKAKDVELKKVQLKNKTMRDRIKKVEFHKPYTIVWWNDGTKTIVKKQPGDKWDKEKGLLAAMAKHYYMDTNIFNDELRKWCK